MKIIFTLFILALITFELHAQWAKVSTFPENGNASHIVAINGTILIANNGNAYDITPKFHNSTNIGENWTVLESNLSENITDLIEVEGTIYATTFSSGVYKSSDKGKNWTAININLQEGIKSYDMHYSNGRLYLAGSGLFYSENMGESWLNIDFEGIAEAKAIYSKGDTIIASITTNSKVAVYRTTNLGKNWTEITASSGLSESSLTKLFENNGVLFACNSGMSSGKVFYSSDYGVTWKIANGVSNSSSDYPYQFLAYNNKLFLATENGVYVSKDEGKSWSNKGIDNAASLAIIDNTIFAGTGSKGLWKENISNLVSTSDLTLSKTKINLYPNPATNVLNIVLSNDLVSQSASLVVYNILGNEVMRQTATEQNNKFDISSLSNGIYMLQISYGTYMETKRFIKK